MLFAVGRMRERRSSDLFIFLDDSFTYGLCWTGASVSGACATSADSCVSAL